MVIFEFRSGRIGELKKVWQIFELFGMSCTFDSSNDFVAQLVEQQTENLCVVGSIPTGTTES